MDRSLKMRSKTAATIGLLACLVASMAILCRGFDFSNGRFFIRDCPIIISNAGGTPWKCVGGCGAGASGGVNNTTPKWVGTGVSGGLIDIQAIYSRSIGRNYSYDLIDTRLSIRPTASSAIGLSLPVVSKIGPFQQSTASAEIPGNVTGGLGDIRIDYMKNFGLHGEYAITGILSLPTGQYDIKRGEEKSRHYLPVNLQKGSGVYSLTVDLGYTKDVERGLWLFDLSYTHPFAVNFKGKNRFVNDNADQFNQLNIPSVWDQLSDEEKKRFHYHFKPYGENDLGGYVPPNVFLSAYYGYKGMPSYVHSAGLTFSFPVGVAWVPDFNCKNFDPKPDPYHQAWSASVNYGLEFSKPTFPVFIGFSLPFHDKTSVTSTTSPKPENEYDTRPMAHWDWPDFKDFGQQWSVFIGIKSTFF
jgi:hypothetical protein